MILSIKETELLLVSSALGTYEQDGRGYEILRLFDKLHKLPKKRLLKIKIAKDIESFKKLNKITDLKVYKK